MIKSGKTGAVRTRVTADPARISDICHRYAGWLYQQAFLTIGDSASAEHVVRVVLAASAAVEAGGQLDGLGPRGSRTR